LLAVSSEQRAAQIADVPSVSESGYPGFNVVTWNGLMAPAGTPKPIIDRMATDMNRAVKDPKFAQRLIAYGADPLGSSPAEFADLINKELPLWVEAVEIAGVKTQ
jgi:tripartite-type tricarboxylate transporter receptor subunit TctC